MEIRKTRNCVKLGKTRGKYDDENHIDSLTR